MSLPHTEEELREEFKDFYDSIESEFSSKKGKTLEECTDFWLSKIRSREERMKEAIEGMKHEHTDTKSCSSSEECVSDYNDTLDEVLDLFSNTDVR